MFERNWLLLCVLLLEACATSRLGTASELQRIRPHLAPTREAPVPAALVGDWARPGQRIRFDSGGRLFQVESLPFTLDGDTLVRGPEKYTRRAGTSGALAGVWRTSFPEGEWLELTFGAGAFYEFAWNDGLRGAGSVVVEGDQLTIVEHRADVIATGQTLLIRVADRTTEYAASWAIVGDELTLTFADGPVVYRRVALY